MDRMTEQKPSAEALKAALQFHGIETFHPKDGSCKWCRRLALALDEFAREANRQAIAEAVKMDEAASNRIEALRADLKRAEEAREQAERERDALKKLTEAGWRVRGDLTIYGTNEAMAACMELIEQRDETIAALLGDDWIRKGLAQIDQAGYAALADGRALRILQEKRKEAIDVG